MIVDQDNLLLLMGVSESITDEEMAFIQLLHPLAEGIVKKYLMYDPEYGDHTELLPRHLQAGGVGKHEADNRYDISGGFATLISTSGFSTLQVTHLPIRVITTVHVDYDARHGVASGAFGTDTLKVNGTDYWVDWDIDGLCRSGEIHYFGSWPSSPGTVKVVYTAGYTADELLGNSGTEVDGSGITMAVMLTVAKTFHTWQALKKGVGTGWTAGDMKSEKLGDYSYTLADKPVAALTGLQVALPPEAVELLQPHKHYGVMRL